VTGWVTLRVPGKPVVVAAGDDQAHAGPGSVADRNWDRERGRRPGGAGTKA